MTPPPLRGTSPDDGGGKSGRYSLRTGQVNGGSSPDVTL